MAPRRIRQNVVLAALLAASLAATVAVAAIPAGAATSAARSTVQACWWCQRPKPTTSTPKPTPTPAPAPPTCGGTSLVKPDGSPWVCSFDDEFDGTSLDRSKWLVQQTATSGYHTGAECYVDSVNNVAVGNGTLRLTVRKESVPFTCKTPAGGYATQYTSGSVDG